MNNDQVFFFDARVQGWRDAAAALPGGALWFEINSTQDGVEQMRQALSGLSGLQAIHIISHGSAGRVQLGAGELSSATLAGYADALWEIGASLADGGDILLYGCSVGAGDTGAAFVEAVYRLTGADVAASDDLTGTDGDWVLEASAGEVTTAALQGSSLIVALRLIRGTEGNDTLTGDGLENTIYGEGGNDSIDGEAASDWIDGGAGADTLDGNFGNDTIYGGSGDDTLRDSQGSNQLYGEDGEDNLSASALTGEHTLSGGLGNDTIDGIGKSLNLQGGDGVDKLTASGALNANNTTTYVQQGNATLSGGAGNDGGWYYADWASGGAYGYDGLQARYLANALLQGGDGNDRLYVEFTKNARLEGGAGADFLGANAYGGWALDYIGESYGINYQLDGGADDDLLNVTSYASRYYGRIDLSLEGGTGNDKLNISTSNPAQPNIGISSAVLSGGDGDDRIEANGVLQLSLTGGAGTDTFVLTAQQYQAQQKATMQFATQQPTQANGWSYAFTDVSARPLEITDFAAGSQGEKLDIRDLLQNGASNYDGTNPFKTGHLDIQQSGNDTLLKFDANGGANSFVTLAVLRSVRATELVAKNLSPLFGTPNGDIMSGLNGDKKHEGLGGKDVMVAVAAPEDETTWINNIDSLLADPNLPAEDNILDGGDDADTMAGGNGNDTYYIDNVGDVVKEAAGQGNADKVIATIDYALGGNVENLQIGNGAANGTKGTGNALNNVLQGNDAGNELSGGGGNDQLKGGKGKDKLVGGDGDDVVDAGEGDDEIVGGDGAGNDTYIGGAGIDTVRYTSAITGITVDLAAGSATGNEIGTDSLSGIENIIGGQAGDTLRGDAQANDIDGYTGDDLIEGGGGNDTLTGGVGNDTLNGGVGSDSLSGGDGIDTARFSGTRASYTVTWSAATSTFIVTSADEGTDTLSGIESLSFPDGTVASGVFQLVPNTSPTGANASASTSEDTALTGTLPAATDAEGDAVTYAKATDPTKGTVTVSSTGGYTYTPTANYSGPDSFTYTVSDGQGGSNTYTVSLTVTAVNDVPVATGGSLSTAEDTQATGTVTATDVDNASLTYAVVSQPANGSVVLGANGTYTYTPNADFNGTDSFTFKANDGTADSNTATAAVTVAAVNDSPMLATSLADRSVTPGSSLNFSFGASAFTDVETASLTYSATRADGSALPDWLGFNASTRTFSGTPASGDLGTVSVKVTASDGSLSASDTFHIVVSQQPNTAPTGANTTASTSEDTVLTGTLPAATDAEGNAVTYAKATDPTKGTVTITGTGGYTYTPTANYSGPDNFTYAVSDSLGGSNTYTVSVAVSPVNDVPTGAVLITGAAAQGQVLTASNNLADADGISTSGTGAVKYQWKADDIAIAGATGSTLTLTEVHLGAVITVTASYTDGGGTAETVTSAGTAAVQSPLGVLKTGTAGPDSLVGTALADTLQGADGNDTLNGGAGADMLEGGAGDDLYLVDTAADVVVETENAGIDRVSSSVNYTLGAHVENLTLTGTATTCTGNELANVLIGSTTSGVKSTLTGASGNDSLTGGAGTDSLLGGDGDDLLNGGAGADRMEGGSGDDAYTVDNAGDVIVETEDGGVDRVSSSVNYTLPANVENLTLTGTALNAIGNANANLITGNTAANSLSGGAGDDTLVGGAGNDVYEVDASGDVVVEQAAQGTDRVNSSVSWVLSANVEALVLTGTAANGTGNDLANSITGNAADNSLVGGAGVDTLIGNAGADTLDGGAGADVMQGGSGNDVYIVDSLTDQTVETSTLATEIDTVISSVTRALGANLEYLMLTGSALNGTGNATANRIQGNELANSLQGLAGLDTLIGGSGNDTLNGGTGADRLEGGLGNDQFVVDSTSDTVLENTDEGTDLVTSTVNWTLGAHVENLTLAGTAAISGTGNELGNLIMGNSAANLINGAAGADTLNGAGGADTLVGGDGADLLTGGAGADVFSYLTRSQGGDTITDFAAGIDKIRVSAAAFGLTPNQSVSLLINQQPTSTRAVFLYSTSTGELLFDPDGTGSQPVELIAVLSTKPNITAIAIGVGP